MSNDIQKPKYWRSFDELSQTEDWKTLASQEFEHGTSVEPLVTGQSRRRIPTVSVVTRQLRIRG